MSKAKQSSGKSGKAVGYVHGDTKEELTCLSTAQWFCRRPETFVGSCAFTSALVPVFGWRHQLEAIAATPGRGVHLADGDRARFAATEVVLTLSDTPLAATGCVAAVPAPAMSAVSADDAGHTAAADDAGGDADGAVADADGGEEVEDNGAGDGAGTVVADNNEDEHEEEAAVCCDDGGEQEVDQGPKALNKPKVPKVPKGPEACAGLLLLDWQPCAYKVVDEILQNAADRVAKDASMKSIYVAINSTSGVVTVTNDGSGIPVVIPDPAEFPEAPPGQYWPTIMFSKTQAGGNLLEVEGEAHHAGGRNGVGAKATNLLSSWFQVTVGDPVNRKRFVQQWRRGMNEVCAPVISSYTRKTGFVEVAFQLNAGMLAAFAEGDTDAAVAATETPVSDPPAPAPLPAGLAAIIRSRVWELAALVPSGIRVHLDGLRLPVKGMPGLAALFRAPSAKTVRPAYGAIIADTVLWEACILPAGGNTGLPPGCIAFVNAVRCDSGKHVDHVLDKIVVAVEEAVARAAGGRKPKPVEDVAKCVFIVLNVKIDGPRFKDQTKTHLDTPPKQWGFKWDMGEPAWETFAKRLCTLLVPGLVARLTGKAADGALKEANKLTVGGKARIIPKYEPAQEAGNPRADTMLLLCEGDSAKGLGMAGRAVTGAKLVGVYCLKGKPMNVRTNGLAAVSKHERFIALKTILGLEYGKTYADAAQVAAEVRYKRLVVMADQDSDGGHIVGLVLNWIEALWPTLLLAVPDFVQRFATPIVVARPIRGGTGTPPVRFLSLPQFQAWLADQPDRKVKYKFQYYKGLAGHGEAAGRQYFADMENHVIALRYRGAPDRAALEAFFGSDSGPRQAMILAFNPGTAFVDYGRPWITVEEYLHKEVLPYFVEHCGRNLPGFDGLKEAQRKILASALASYPVGRVVKLQALAMKAGGDMGYHHGDESLYNTTVGLGQTHPGTNNINLLICDGIFGTRAKPRKEHPAPRYMATGVPRILPTIFRAEDWPILTYCVDDGSKVVEPSTFLPVVPLILINGCEGLASGFNCNFPPFHPLEVAALFRSRIVDPETVWRSNAAGMRPWVDNFQGEIGGATGATGAWTSTGLYTIAPGARPRDAETVVTIVELPLGTWTEEFVSGTLGAWAVGAVGEGKGFIKRFHSETTDAKVHYTLYCDTAALEKVMGDAVAPPFVADPRGLPTSADASVVAAAAEVYATGAPRRPALEAALNLTATRQCKLRMFDHNGNMVLYKDLADMVDAFARARLEGYAHRLRAAVAAQDRVVLRLRNRARFIDAMLSGMDGRAFASTKKWWAELAKEGYLTDDAPETAEPPRALQSNLPVSASLAKFVSSDATNPKESTNGHDNVDHANDDHDNDDGDDDEDVATEATEAAGAKDAAKGNAAGGFKSLTSMGHDTITAEAVAQLRKQVADALAKRDFLASQTPEQVWLAELAEFEEAYKAMFAARRKLNVIQRGRGGKATADDIGTGGKAKALKRPRAKTTEPKKAARLKA